MVLLSRAQVVLASLLPFPPDAPTSNSAAPTDTSTHWHAEHRCGFETTTSWGSLSPYRENNGFDVSKGSPRGCELSQVHVLQRHAQRYPENSPLSGDVMEAFDKKLTQYRHDNPNASVGRGPLSFLDRWQYRLGRNDLLVTGAAAEAAVGADIWSKYGRVLYRAPSRVPAWEPWMNVYPNGTERPKPIFRATNSSRIVQSARWWSGRYLQ